MLPSKSHPGCRLLCPGSRCVSPWACLWLTQRPLTCSAFLPAATMPLSQSRAGQVPCSSKVCRNLFGPVDHDQLQNDFEDLLRQHLEEARHRWNFNFETETPLEGHFKWERVLLAEQPSQEILNLGKATNSECRSSLAHKVPSKDHLGGSHAEASQQSSEFGRAGSPQHLKRGQATIKGEFWCPPVYSVSLLVS